MQCAAHTKGGSSGVPQSVGNEFIRKDDADAKTEPHTLRKGANLPPSARNQTQLGNRSTAIPPPMKRFHCERL